MQICVTPTSIRVSGSTYHNCRVLCACVQHRMLSTNPKSLQQLTLQLFTAARDHPDCGPPYAYRLCFVAVLSIRYRLLELVITEHLMVFL